MKNILFLTVFSFIFLENILITNANQGKRIISKKVCQPIIHAISLERMSISNKNRKCWIEYYERSCDSFTLIGTDRYHVCSDKKIHPKKKNANNL